MSCSTIRRTAMIGLLAIPRSTTSSAQLRPSSGAIPSRSPQETEVRIGLVGLSTPIAFDYGVEATRTLADVASSPNPILDSPFGLMLLYDELWFVCRSLCPENMRGCSFVRFLDE